MAEAVTKLVDAVCCIIHDGSPLRAEDQSAFYTGYLFTVLKVSVLDLALSWFGSALKHSCTLRLRVK